MTFVMILSNAGAEKAAHELLYSCFSTLIKFPVLTDEICRYLNLSVWLRALEDIDGFAVQDETGKIGIVINARHQRERRRFSIAHEIGHFSCGHLVGKVSKGKE